MHALDRYLCGYGIRDVCVCAACPGTSGGPRSMEWSPEAAPSRRGRRCLSGRRRPGGWQSDRWIVGRLSLHGRCAIGSSSRRCSSRTGILRACEKVRRNRSVGHRPGHRTGQTSGFRCRSLAEIVPSQTTNWSLSSTDRVGLPGASRDKPRRIRQDINGTAPDCALPYSALSNLSASVER